MNPLVSVVIPTYGRPNLVCETVESVIAQTYRNTELVIVDDCSPRPVEPVLQELLSGSSIDIQCIQHDQNRGANTARNTGIDAASGSYIAFLDDDDLWEPTKLERQVEAFRRAQSGVGVVYTGRKLVDSEGTVTRHTTPATRGDVTKAILRWATIGPFSTLMVNVDVIKRAGLPDEGFPRWQDREWCLRLSRHCKFEVVPEPLVVRRFGRHDQISDDFDAQCEAASLYLKKHRSLAAHYGWVEQRRFANCIYSMVARNALISGHYTEGIRYSLKTIGHNPLSVRPYLYLIAAIGGPYSTTLARTVHRAYHRARIDRSSGSPGGRCS